MGRKTGCNINDINKIQKLVAGGNTDAHAIADHLFIPVETAQSFIDKFSGSVERAYEEPEDDEDEDE